MGKYISGCVIVIVLLAALLLPQLNWQYEYPGWTRTVNITGSTITFTRSDNMVLTARSAENSKIALFKSLGWMQAHDRYVQLCLYRLAAQGLLTTHLPFTKSSFKSDVKAKQMNIMEISEKSLPQIPQADLQKLQYYVDGINTYLESHPRPVEFILFNYHPEPFVVADYFSMLNYISYAGLNDICLTVEKLIIELASETNFDLDLLKSVYFPHLENIDEDLIELYKSLKDMRPLADHDTSEIPKLVNSNNWVVSSALSESGFPIMGSDPHMDVSKNPNIFYESHYIGEDGFTVFGISIPGVASIIFGRTDAMVVSLTFGMLDMSDYFIEDIVDMQYKRDDTFYPLRERVYEIGNQTIYFYDTKEGHTLERRLEALSKPLTDGRYLATTFSLCPTTNVANAKILSVMFAKDVEEVRKFVWENGIGTNFLIADTQGNIAYQQGGMVPVRHKSTGLLPLPAWHTANLWDGYLTGEDYHSIVNPPEGYLATANNLIQAEGKPVVTTFAALHNRVNRVVELLQSKAKFNVADFKRFQSDTHSLVAQKVVPMLKPFLGDTGIETELANWDFKYRLDSKPAAFYKLFYVDLQRNILLQTMHKDRVDKYLRYAGYSMSGVVAHILHTGYEGSTAVPGTTVSDVLRVTLAQTLSKYRGEVYGDLEHFFMNNMLFGGKLPGGLLDVAPRPTTHCEECVKVGVQRKNQEGIPIYISQAWRMVTDLGTEEVHTVLPGGPSGNILSNIYNRETDMYLADEYKITNLHPDK